MDLKDCIVKLGTEGVLRYRTMSRVSHDNQLPEVFLGGWVASGLHDAFSCSVHVEHLYTAIAISRGIAITEELVALLGSYRADVAMFLPESPPAVVEFKIFDEGCAAAAVAGDLHKMKKLADVCSVTPYVGVMICQTPAMPLNARISQLEETLGIDVYTGEPQISTDGHWRWCFGCSCPAAATSFVGTVRSSAEAKES